MAMATAAALQTQLPPPNRTFDAITGQGIAAHHPPSNDVPRRAGESHEPTGANASTALGDEHLVDVSRRERSRRTPIR